MNPRNLKLATNLFINGKFVPSIQGKTFDVINPSDQSLLAKVQHAQKEDVDLAVKSARQAFDNGPWRRMDPTDRARCMFKLADLIQKNAEELAGIEAMNNGKPWHIAKVADLVLTHRCIRYYAGWIDKIRGHTINMDGPFFAYTKKQPVGVVGQVIPWNFPLLMLAWKWGPALAAGCTIVMKTAEQTPLSALRVAQLVNEAGFPPGVINVISGQGDTGAYLVRHPGIDKVAFTGSTDVGYDIMRNSHVQNLKRITLQLGGKSANVITANANLDVAVGQSHMGLFFNAGQCCIASSRTFVHQSIYDKFIERLAPVVKGIKLGDSLSESTDQGPLVSKDQMERVLSFIEHGKKQGARLVTGGKRHGSKGWFVEPTLFVDVKDDMKIAKEQIFGPVLSVFKYKDNDEVLQRANDSNYGLGAGVVTENFQQMKYFVERFRSGTVYGNCWNVFSSMTPFGGYKDSGIGRELGEQGLQNYLETKTVILKK